MAFELSIEFSPVVLNPQILENNFQLEPPQLTDSNPVEVSSKKQVLDAIGGLIAGTVFSGVGLLGIFVGQGIWRDKTATALWDVAGGGAMGLGVGFLPVAPWVLSHLLLPDDSLEEVDFIFRTLLLSGAGVGFSLLAVAGIGNGIEQLDNPNPGESAASFGFGGANAITALVAVGILFFDQEEAQ